MGRQYIHIRNNIGSYKEAHKTYLLACWIDGTWFNVTNQDISAVLKEAARVLQYLKLRGIHKDDIDTHSLWTGGANALALLGVFRPTDSKHGQMERPHVHGIHQRQTE